MSLANKVGKARSGGGMAGRVRQGDPGLWGSIVGGVKGFITGGPTGAIAGAIGGSKSKTSGMQVNRLMAQPSAIPQVPRPGIVGTVQRAAPGGATGMIDFPATPGASIGGYHANKTDYFLKDGTFVPKGTKWVKNRRRNSLNPRALSKALARVTGFKSAASKASRITIRSGCCKKKG